MAAKAVRITFKAPSRPYAEWLCGLALAMLAMGLFDLLRPLLPETVQGPVAIGHDAEEVAFIVPPVTETPADHPEATPQPPAESPPAAPEIPALLDFVPQITPPEIPELLAEKQPPTAPPPKPPAANPRPPSAEKPRSGSAATASTANSPSKPSSAPVLFTGRGGGRFPQPTYPLAAKASHSEGTVMLAVTVEANGMPSSVEVRASSGSRLLDSAAADCIRRRWRWTAGPVRYFKIPIEFVLR